MGGVKLPLVELKLMSRLEFVSGAVAMRYEALDAAGCRSSVHHKGPANYHRARKPAPVTSVIWARTGDGYSVRRPERRAECPEG